MSLPEDIERIGPFVENVGMAITQVVTRSLEVEQALKLVRDQGFKIHIQAELSFYIAPIDSKETREPEPKVKDGEVIPGTYDPSDEKFLNALKIKL